MRKAAGLPPRTAGQAAIAAFKAVIAQSRVEVEKDGKRFTVPLNELDEALKQGYTKVKK